tara:strand:+ start:283 stop:1689 length:1407 start_codon:yes stop_codon:yes gene_type:complete
MRPLGLVEFSTTSNIGSGTSIISTELTNRFSNDDFFNGWFVTIVVDNDDGTSTPANGLGTTTRRVTDYATSSGTLTVAGANLSAEDEVVDCDLYTVHPDDIKRAYEKARQVVFERYIGIVRDTETLVTGQSQVLFTIPSTVRKVQRIYLGDTLEAVSHADNLLLNGGFEDWSSATSPDNWDLTGGGAAGATVHQEQQTHGPSNYMVLNGSSSMKLYHPATDYTIYERQTLNPSQSIAIENVELNFSVWVYCTGSSNTSFIVHALLEGAGVTSQPVYSDKHGLTGWERMKVSGLTDKDAVLNSNVTVGIGLDSDDSTGFYVYIDEAFCVAGPDELAEAPWEPILDYEILPPVGGASNGGLIRLKHPLPEKKRLRIVGLDYLSTISTDATTIEIDGDLLEPLYDLMRSYLCEERASPALTGKVSAQWALKAAEYRQKFENATLRLGLEMPGPRLRDPAVVAAGAAFDAVR